MTNGESFRHGGQNRMSDDTTGALSVSEPDTGWERLRGTGDAELRAAIEADTDVRSTDDAFRQGAKVVWPQQRDGHHAARC